MEQALDDGGTDGGSPSSPLESEEILGVQFYATTFGTVVVNPETGQIVSVNPIGGAGVR